MKNNVKNSRLILIIVTFFQIVMLFQIIGLCDDSVTIITLTSSKSEVNVGEKFTLTITIDPNEIEIGGWQLSVVFPSDIIQANSVTPGVEWDELFDSGSIQNDVGLIDRIQSWKKESYPNYTHTACLIEFQVIGNGAISINLDNVNVTNFEFNDIEFIIESITLNNKGNSNNNDNDPTTPVDDTNRDNDDTNNENPVNDNRSENSSKNDTTGDESNDQEGNGSDNEESELQVDNKNGEDSDLVGTKVTQTGLDNNLIPLIIIICVVSILFIIYKYRNKI